MDSFLALNSFCSAIADDVRIGTTHVSLYVALLQQWNFNGGKNPFYIDRKKIMKVAKINGRHTYNKCINNLHDYGYLFYQPSTNGSRPSSVYLKNIQ